MEKIFNNIADILTGKATTCLNIKVLRGLFPVISAGIEFDPEPEIKIQSYELQPVNDFLIANNFKPVDLQRDKIFLQISQQYLSRPEGRALFKKLFTDFIDYNINDPNLAKFLKSISPEELKFLVFIKIQYENKNN